MPNRRRQHDQRIRPLTSRVTAAAIGAIAGAVVVLGRRTIFEGWSPEIFKLAVLLGTVGLLWNFKKLPEPILVAVAAVAGLIAYRLTH